MYPVNASSDRISLVNPSWCSVIMTAVIITEHHDGFTNEIRSEDAFTGYIKVIAIDQGDKCIHCSLYVLFFLHSKVVQINLQKLKGESNET